MPSNLIERRKAVEAIVTQHCSLHREEVVKMVQLETTINRMKGRLYEVERAAQEVGHQRMYIRDDETWNGDSHYFPVSAAASKTAARALRAQVAHQRRRIKAVQAQLSIRRSRFYEELYRQFDGLWELTKTTKQAAKDIVELRTKLLRKGYQI